MQAQHPEGKGEEADATQALGRLMGDVFGRAAGEAPPKQDAPKKMAIFQVTERQNTFYRVNLTLPDKATTIVSFSPAKINCTMQKLFEALETVKKKWVKEEALGSLQEVKADLHQQVRDEVHGIDME